MSITEIIRRGFANGDSYATINKALADNGFDLKLVPREKSGWSEQEMKEGFKEGVTAKEVVHLADMMKPHRENAGMTIRVQVAEGEYDITYDSTGYALKAVRK